MIRFILHFFYFCIRRKNSYAIGDIAQLARARDWQSRGQGFDSPYLHTLDDR